MSTLTGDWTDLPGVAAKAALLVFVAVVGLRISHRRTVAQWSVVDVVAAVSLGAVVGRTAVATTSSFIVGAVAVATILLVHRVLTAVRGTTLGRRALDHRIRVLVAGGVVRERECRRCGVTAPDLEEQLRLRGVFDLESVRYVLFEEKGGFTVVHDQDAASPLVVAALEQAAGGSDRAEGPTARHHGRAGRPRS